VFILSHNVGKILGYGLQPRSVEFRIVLNGKRVNVSRINSLWY
jgi:hypothetical protein